MFWDRVAGIYDLFEDLYNGKVFQGTGEVVAQEIEADDEVLECACGTGAISVYLAKKCKRLIATDFSSGMRKRAAKNCEKYGNVTVRMADIMHLKCRDERFDKVVAGNVIHLLDNPEAAVAELYRVCKKGGKMIIPTYINLNKKGGMSLLIRVFHKAGANFKRQFDEASYRKFFEGLGYSLEKCTVVQGRVPCAVAVIRKE